MAWSCGATAAARSENASRSRVAPSSQAPTAFPLPRRPTVCRPLSIMGDRVGREVPIFPRARCRSTPHTTCALIRSADRKASGDPTVPDRSSVPVRTSSGGGRRGICDVMKRSGGATDHRRPLPRQARRAIGRSGPLVVRLGTMPRIGRERSVARLVVPAATHVHQLGSEACEPVTGRGEDGQCGRLVPDASPLYKFKLLAIRSSLSSSLKRRRIWVSPPSRPVC